MSSNPFALQLIETHQQNAESLLFMPCRYHHDAIIWQSFSAPGFARGIKRLFHCLALPEFATIFSYSWIYNFYCTIIAIHKFISALTTKNNFVNITRSWTLSCNNRQDGECLLVTSEIFLVHFLITIENLSDFKIFQSGDQTNKPTHRKPGM